MVVVTFVIHSSWAKLLAAPEDTGILLVVALEVASEALAGSEAGGIRACFFRPLQIACHNNLGSGVLVVEAIYLKLKR
jgi:hypothetical protein